MFVLGLRLPFISFFKLLLLKTIVLRRYVGGGGIIGETVIAKLKWCLLTSAHSYLSYSILFISYFLWMLWFLKFVCGYALFYLKYREPPVLQVCQGPEVTLGSKDFQAWKVLFCALLFGCKYNDWDSQCRSHTCLLNSHSHPRQLGFNKKDLSVSEEENLKIKTIP